MHIGRTEARCGGLHQSIEMLEYLSCARFRFALAPRSLLIIGAVVAAPSVGAQTRIQAPSTMGAERSGAMGESDELGELLRLANSANPSIAAARARVAAAKARVGPAAAWPDPMLMAGIQNLPVSKTSAAPPNGAPGDDMTMKMIGVGQKIPYPGKLGLQRQIAAHEVDAANAALESSSTKVERDVRKSYFELAYLERAIELVNQSQPVLADVIRVAETRYAAGISGQQDVLKARIEAARLGETASTLLEQRRAIMAELNALLDRGSTTPLGGAQIPDRITRAAGAGDPERIRFATQILGSRRADSPLPPLEELQDLAARRNPELREREAMIAAQSARAALARQAVKPDFDLSLQYGQRNQRPDMVSAVVSIPLPIHKRARQDEEIAEARAELGAMQAEQAGEVNKVRAEVARLVSDLERNRTQLALYAKAILPQGQAAVSSSLASYQAGKSDLLNVLDNRATLFAYQTANYRALADFAKTLADLEAVVGAEVLK